MSVASHLAVSPAGYDRRIRQLILHYDELIAEAARALRYSRRPVKSIVDLGVGTGALANACLQHAKGARLWGIDADTAMLEVASIRLHRYGNRITLTGGDFTSPRTKLPRADAMVASYALHHIRSPRAKLAFYRRCRQALRPGGILISGDCAPASTPRAAESDLRPWLEHLAKASGSLKTARRTYESWGDEDTYLPLKLELGLLRRAGFDVDVPWRRAPFAVIAAVASRR